ncbi:MAG: hypothetical protein J3R72DRAFT_458280 [Linnemannia gamsii]|nr:MAG: hypothetical protein J3R72DRAFT_458278 [Linnemannia gamsii]KAK3824303.1 MAG: hypothetical protein J3R72DRAFT_458280 [Linnemannia gamsii]
MHIKYIAVALLFLQVVLAMDPLSFYLQMQDTIKVLAAEQSGVILCAMEALAADEDVDHCGLTIDKACSILKPYVLMVVPFGDEIAVLDELMRLFNINTRC